MTRTRTQVEQSARHPVLGPRLREGAFIGVSAVCLYLLLALLSYSPRDPGWSATGTGSKISNLGGPTGAWLADVSFSLVGYAAYLFPLLLAYRAVIILVERHQDKGFDWVTFGIRALGLVLVMIAGTALAALNDVGGSSLPQGAGGILGQAIGSNFTHAFSAVGSRLTHQDLDDITVTGIDGHLQLGSHFLDDGWRRWVSFGFFTDIWTSPAASFTVQGLSAGLGAGYAWSKVQIDVQASVRSPESTHSRLQELGMAAERTPFLGQVTLSWRI